MNAAIKDNSDSFDFCQGFFCRTEDEFDDWCMRIRRVRFQSPHFFGNCKSAPWELETYFENAFFYQLSCNRDNLPMFELVDSQPSHMVSVDAINLTPGEKTDSCFPFNFLI